MARVKVFTGETAAAVWVKAKKWVGDRGMLKSIRIAASQSTAFNNLISARDHTDRHYTLWILYDE